MPQWSRHYEYASIFQLKAFAAEHEKGTVTTLEMAVEDTAIAALKAQTAVAMTPAPDIIAQPAREFE